MLNKTLAIIACCLACHIAVSQQRVKIVDIVSEEVLPGATVHVANLLYVADGDGFVELPREATGQPVTIRFIGYETRQFYLSPGTEIIRLTPDYLVLETVTVSAYQNQHSLRDVAGSYSIIAGKGISESGSQGVVNSVNSIPGLRMEKRSPGSYRINIRGSTLRSPFGVRNVKIYFNQIPVTEPNGNTPLNLLDLEHLSSVSVIRSPSASLYGAGTGGVLFLSGQPGAQDGIEGDLEFSAGSFGYTAQHAGIQHRNGDDYVRLTAGRIGSSGYRDHTELKRKNVGLTGNINFSEAHSLSYIFLYNDIFYELPGGLTREQREEDPTQARQIAVERNSSIDQTYFTGGVSHRLEWAEESGNETSLFITQANKENPFITNYEFEDLGGAGMRTRFFHTISKQEWMVRLSAGGEWQWGRFRASNFGNIGGHPDTLRYVDDTRMFTGFEFLQAEFESGRWVITAGASINHLSYTFNRLRDVAADSSYKVRRTFKNQFSPRLGIVYRWSRNAVFFNVSRGFSPPTQDEVRTSDGSLNAGLEAEEALSFEAGMRSDLVPGRLSGEITLYHILQENTIVSLVDEFGNSLFRNSGQTAHKGLELVLSGVAVSSGTGPVRKLTLKGSLAWNDLRFRRYERASGDENEDYSGNALTGGVPLTYYLEASLQLDRGFGVVLTHLFTDAIPLNDENSVYSNPYHLVRARMEKIFYLKAVEIKVFAGADNLVNETYSLGNDLNAFGSRYFNPSPTRNYYGGVTIGF